MLVDLGDDVSGVGYGAGEPVQSGHDEHVAGTQGGDGFAEAGTFGAGGTSAFVGVDPLRCDPEPVKLLQLDSEVLPLGADPGASDYTAAPGWSW